MIIIEHNPNDDLNRIMIHGILSRVPVTVALALSDSWTIKSKSCRLTLYFPPNNNFEEFAIDDYIMKKKRQVWPRLMTARLVINIILSRLLIFSTFMGYS